MDAVNNETKAAIKLTRADAVKLVAAEMIALAAHDVDSCADRVAYCADEFRAAVVRSARVAYYDPLEGALNAVGATVDSMHAMTTYRVYDDGSDSGTSAQVIFSDDQKTYEARMRIAVSIQLNAVALDLRRDWRTALYALKAARERDLRVGAMKKEAREVLIKAALDSSDEGIAVVGAIRSLAAMLKGKS